MGDLLRLPQHRLTVLETRLDGLALRDVGHHRERAPEAAAVEDGVRLVQHRDRRAILALEGDLPALGSAPPARHAVSLGASARLVDQVECGHPDQLARFVTEHLGQPRVGEHEAIVRVRDAHALPRGLDDLAVKLRAAAEHTLRLAPRRENAGNVCRGDAADRGPAGTRINRAGFYRLYWGFWHG